MKEEIIKMLEEDNVEIDFISHIPYKCTTTWGAPDKFGSEISTIKIGDHSINPFNHISNNVSSDLMKKIKQSIINTIKNHE